jgi:hypothetical protein
MEINFTRTIALTSIAISLIALFFTFRRDAHRISLEVTPLWERWIEVIGINNDSSFPVGVLSVGYFESTSKVLWLSSVSCFAKNFDADFPIRIEARSLCTLQVAVARDVPNPSTARGYCVQLESGRIYVIRHTAPWRISLKFNFSSLISRITAGRIAPWVEQPRLPF